MTHRRILAIPALALPAVAIALAGCGGGYGSASSAQASSPAKGSSAVVAVRPTKLGKVLVDGQGRTLYLFEKDRGTRSTCSGSCAGLWPPLTTSGRPRAGAGAQASLLGTTGPAGAARQVTYHGHPLYRYAGDRAPGQTTGEGIHSFGGGWDVLSPAGEKIEGDGSASSSSSSSSSSGSIGY